MVSARLAHEVTHVVQQSRASSFTPGEDATLEHQANASSAAVLAGQAADISSVASAPAIIAVLSSLYCERMKYLDVSSNRLAESEKAALEKIARDKNIELIA